MKRHGNPFQPTIDELREWRRAARASSRTPNMAYFAARNDALKPAWALEHLFVLSMHPDRRTRKRAEKKLRKRGASIAQAIDAVLKSVGPIRITTASSAGSIHEVSIL